MKRVNIHEGLDTTLLILQHRLKEKPGCPAIEVVKKYGTLPPVECHSGQLNQVFMNILANAIDAIASRLLADAAPTVANANDALESKRASSKRAVPGESQPLASQASPRIEICTEILNSSESKSSEDVKSVVIRIRDNGMGMTERVRRQLFDPFFTTKPVGQGTGLGLSISYQIVVAEHGGRIECVSAPGKGTEFTIQIPVLQSERQLPARSKATSEPQKLMSQNRQTCHCLEQPTAIDYSV